MVKRKALPHTSDSPGRRKSTRISMRSSASGNTDIATTETTKEDICSLNDKLLKIADGTVLGLGYLALSHKKLMYLRECGKLVYSNGETKDLFKKVYEIYGEQGINKLFEALTDDRCCVVQLFAGGDGWYFDGNRDVEMQFMNNLREVLPRTKLIAINLGERDPTEKWWEPFLKVVQNSLLGHLWINEQGKGTCPPEVRGSKARRDKKGVIISPPTGLQLMLFKNRGKLGYKEVGKDASLVCVLNSGLKCWRDYKAVNKTV